LHLLKYIEDKSLYEGDLNGVFSSRFMVALFLVDYGWMFNFIYPNVIFLPSIHTE
jgi:hypothetical protein